MTKTKKMGDLFSRTLTNSFSGLLVALFIFFAEISFFRPFFTAGISLIAAIALWEYYRLVRKKELEPGVKIGIVTAILYVFAVFFQTGAYFSAEIWQYLPEIILGLFLFSLFAYYAVKGQEAILNLSTTFFGLFYIVIPIACFVRIAYFFFDGTISTSPYEGSFWLLYLIAVTKGSDMGGYFFGRWFGKRKLAVRLSPNKTYFGAVAGLVFSVILSVFIAYLGKRAGVFTAFNYLSAVWLGALLAIFGQLGDLAESLLKRDVDTKDSNNIPGVGGVLDMVDSLLFTAPLVYIFLRVAL